jgi:hypothetical protein
VNAPKGRGLAFPKILGSGGTILPPCEDGTEDRSEQKADQRAIQRCIVVDDCQRVCSQEDLEIEERRLAAGVLDDSEVRTSLKAKEN